VERDLYISKETYELVKRPIPEGRPVSEDNVGMPEFCADAYVFWNDTCVYEKRPTY